MPDEIPPPPPPASPRPSGTRRAARGTVPEHRNAAGEPGLVVGIGTGAGGLETFAELVGALPERGGLAFVLVPHLEAGEGPEALAALRKRLAPMPMRDARDGDAPEPGTVLVIPTNRNGFLEKGVLRLGRRTVNEGMEMPVDVFFRSLAADRHARAVGVILSGTQTDGALGVEALKGEGGITFAQEQASAKHPEMPAASVGTGCVDFVLSPAAIARELARLDSHPYVRTVGPEEEISGPVSAPAGNEGTEAHSAVVNAVDAAAAAPAIARPRDLSLQRILTLLRNAVGVDFSQYKPATIERRIARRMALLRMERMGEYVKFLQGNETETLALYHDILIKVTCFFRDPEAFEALKRKVFPRLVKNRPRDEPLRLWAPGCATGEEAYSLAIALAEYLGKHRLAFPVQIFATDLSEPALDRAREGAYIENIALDVSPERLNRFFLRDGRTFHVVKPIRDMIVFARQNLAKDPPFSRLDLVSCRNLLIYLAPPLQKRIFPLFHYALRPSGFLLLGASESVGEFTDLFSPADRKAKLFVRKDNLARPRLEMPLGGLLAMPPRPGFHSHAVQPAAPARAGTSPEAARTDAAPSPDPADEVQREADRLLLNRFTPPGVVVNADLDILQFRGQGHAYFEPSPGKVSFHVTRLIKEPLVLPLRDAVAQARRDGVPARSRATLEADAPGRPPREIEVEAIPLCAADPAAPPHFIILFHEILPDAAPRQESAPPLTRADRAADRQANDLQNRRLQTELDSTRRKLQSVIEEQDLANEEIKSANEEILSANEELQSTNEELQTAKEELQSANEEMSTVNDELTNRNSDLARANDDLNNLLNAVSFAIVMLAPDLTIRRFTAAAGKLFNLLPADLGRPLTDLSLNLRMADLPSSAARVIETMTAHEGEVQDREGRWYALSIRPYRTAERKIDGAVLALADVDTLKRSVEAVRVSRDFSEAVVATVREPLLVLDTDLRVISVNATFLTTFKVTRAATLGRPVQALGDGQWSIPRLTALLEDVAKNGAVFEDFAVEHDFRDLGRRRMVLNARRIDGDSASSPFVLLSIEDFTARRGAEAEVLAIAEREQRRMAHDLHDGLGQQLAGVSLMLKALLGQLGSAGATPEVMASAEAVLTQLNHATSLTRDLARGLHPAQLRAGEFKTAMQTLAENVETLFKVVCVFHCDGSCAAPGHDDESATHLYRLAQEATHNAVRHGKATRISIDYAFDPGTGQGRLTVTDDGVGFRPKRGKPPAKPGMGLQIMRYRAEALRGAFSIEPAPGGGTVAAVSFAASKAA